MNGAGRRLSSVIRRILGVLSDVILSMRTGKRPRDGACAVRSAIHLHGVTVHLHVSRPPSTYFELGGLTLANLRYAGASSGASAL